jgi:hypothetical protein
MTMHSDVRLAASFPEKPFASKVPSVVRTEVPDLRPRSGRLIIFQNSRMAATSASPLARSSCSRWGTTFSKARLPRESRITETRR